MLRPFSKARKEIANMPTGQNMGSAHGMRNEIVASEQSNHGRVDGKKVEMPRPHEILRRRLDAIVVVGGFLLSS
jgi:hypothetical protein